jgi:predicted methyltransferase
MHAFSRHFAIWALLLSALLPTVFAQPTTSDTFKPLLSASYRSHGNVARDPYRHPAETLAFFGIRPDSTVVEILPGSGG